MPKYSEKSLDRLSTCHPDIQAVMNLVILRFDVVIVEGHRPVERQKELYAQGRTKPGRIVTHIDGVTKKGKHNHKPSLAVDVAPYSGDPSAPIDWNDINSFHFMAGHILAAAAQLSVKLEWGGHWKKFKDYPHFQLVT